MSGLAILKLLQVLWIVVWEAHLRTSPTAANYSQAHLRQFVAAKRIFQLLDERLLKLKFLRSMRSLETWDSQLYDSTFALTTLQLNSNVHQIAGHEWGAAAQCGQLINWSRMSSAFDSLSALYTHRQRHAMIVPCAPNFGRHFFVTRAARWTLDEAENPALERSLSRALCWNCCAKEQVKTVVQVFDKPKSFMSTPVEGHKHENNFSTPHFRLLWHTMPHIRKAFFHPAAWTFWEFMSNQHSWEQCCPSEFPKKKPKTFMDPTLEKRSENSLCPLAVEPSPPGCLPCA